MTLSADGQTLLGNSYELPYFGGHPPVKNFRWSRTGGMEFLPWHPSVDTMIATDFSDDGQVVTGGYRIGSLSGAYRYSEPDGFTLLDNDPLQPRFVANGVSGDGSTMFGLNRVESDDGVVLSAAIYKADGTNVDLGFLGTNGILEGSSVSGVSADGSTAVGGSSTSVYGVSQPFMWTESEGMTRITSFERGMATGISRNGKWVIGTNYENDDGVAQMFRWSEETGDELLGYLRRPHDSFMRSISDDGSVIVGYADTSDFSFFDNQAVIWTEEDGIQNLRTHLIDEYGMLELVDWHLLEATSVSADGTVIAGDGFDPDGNRRAFVVVIPSPGTVIPAALLALGGLRRRR